MERGGGWGGDLQVNLHHRVRQGVEDGQAEGRAGRRGGVPATSRAGAPARTGAAGCVHKRREVLAEGEGRVGRGRRGCRRHRPEHVLGGHEEGPVRVGGRLAEARGRRRRVGGGASHVAVVVAGSVDRGGGQCQRLGTRQGRHVHRGPHGGGLGLRQRFLVVVNEVAARAVGAQPDRVVGAAQLRLVLGVAHQCAQLVAAVRELALVAVLARAGLLEGPTQLRLVARRVDVRGGRGRGLAGGGGVGGLAVAAVQLAAGTGARCPSCCPLCLVA